VSRKQELLPLRSFVKSREAMLPPLPRERASFNTVESTLSTHHCRINTVKFDTVNSTVLQPSKAFQTPAKSNQLQKPSVWLPEVPNLKLLPAKSCPNLAGKSPNLAKSSQSPGVKFDAESSHRH